MKPIKGLHPDVFKPDLAELPRESPAHERRFVGRHIVEHRESARMPLEEDLRVQHVRLGEHETTAWFEQGECLTERSVDVKVMQHRRTHDRVELTLELERLEFATSNL